jgi:predicted transcriptional regulator
MTDTFSSSKSRVTRKYITDLTAASFFIDTRNGPLLDVFIGEEGKALKDVAKHLNVSVGNLYYKVKKLEEFGILEVTKEEKRAGRAIKYYRLSAEEFFLPLEFSPFASVEDYLRTQHSPIHELVLKNVALAREREWDGQWGISLRTNTAIQEVSWRLRPDPPQPDTVRKQFLGHRMTQLTLEQAQDLSQRFVELLSKYESASVAGTGTPHIIYVAVTPY